MGTPLPPNEPGEPCNVCWGPGQLLGPLPTPRFVIAQLFDMLPGDNFTPALEQLLITPHLLRQTINPCIWQIIDPPFTWQWVFTLTVSQCLVFSPPPVRNFFTGSSPDLCLLDVPNLATNPADQVMFRGFATLTWALEGL